MTEQELVLKKINSLEEQNKMLMNQVELFEAERTQLVEAAFTSHKEVRQIKIKFARMEKNIDILQELLDKEKEEKKYLNSSELFLYKTVSAAALLVCVVLLILTLG